MGKPPRKMSSGFVEALLAAFPPAPAPKLSELVHNNCDCEQCEFVQENLKGCPWDQLSAETVDRLSTDLSLFSRKAFLYYIPAYFRRAYEGGDSGLVEWIVFSFAPDRYGPKDFTEDQRRVVYRFLNWASSRMANTDAEKFLETWK